MYLTCYLANLVSDLGGFGKFPWQVNLGWIRIGIAWVIRGLFKGNLG